MGANEREFQRRAENSASCSVGWPMLLSSLKTLLETDKPLPDFKPPAE